MEVSPREKELLDALKRNSKGADVQMLIGMFPGMDEAELVSIMNNLSAKQLVDFIHIGKNLAFRVRDMAEVSKTIGLDQNERIVYNIIRAAGNTGIWIKDIKTRSNMHTQVVNNGIRNLEKKGLIKSIKSVKNPTKKLYMLSELEPSTDLTGGAWYTDQEFDLEFIEALSKQCFRIVYHKTFPKGNQDAIYPSTYQGYPTAKEILKLIRTSGITNVELSLEDIKQLLERLVFDGKIYKRVKKGVESYDEAEYDPESQRKAKRRKMEISDAEDEEVLGTVDDYLSSTTTRPFINAEDLWVYIATKETRESNAWTDIPCGKCPVFKFCSDTGPVNPKDCTYYTKWLQF